MRINQQRGVVRQYSDTAYDVDMRYSGDQRQRQLTQATAFTRAYQLAQPTEVARTTMPTLSQAMTPATTGGGSSAPAKTRLLLWLGIPLVFLFVLSSVLWAYAATRPADTVGLQGQPTQTAPVVADHCTEGAADKSANCEEAVTMKKAKVTYTCPDRYKLHEADDRQVCRKHVAGELIAKKANVKYVCPSGYTPAGNYCRGIKTLPVTTTYTCPQGYTRNGTTCKHTSSGATRSASARKSCPAGYYISNNTCKKSVTIGRTAVYYCASGYELEGKTCYTRAAGTYQTTKPKETVQCPDGFTRIENTKVCEERPQEALDVQIEQE